MDPLLDVAILDLIANSREVCFTYTNVEPPRSEAGWHPVGDGVWRRLKPLTRGLICAMRDFVGLSELTPDNISVWFHRIRLLEDSGLTFLSTIDAQGTVVPVSISHPKAFQLHLGLRLAAPKPPLSDIEFTNKFIQLRVAQDEELWHNLLNSAQ